MVQTDPTFQTTVSRELRLGAVPERESLFLNTEHTQEIHDQLELRKPGLLKDAPAVLNFDRARRLEVPWKSIVEAQVGGNPVNASSRALRTYFENSWWGTDTSDNLPDMLQLLLDSVETLIFIRKVLAAEPEPAEKAEKEKPKEEKKEPKPEAPEPARFYRTDPADDAENGIEIVEGVFFRHGMSGRLYLVNLAGSVPDTPADFLGSAEAYEKFWNENVLSVELVFSDPAKAQSDCTSYSVLDVRAPFIVQRYKELTSLKQIADKVKDLADKRIDAALDASMGSTLEMDGLEELQVRYRNISIAPSQIENDFKRLKRQAEDMGYVLFHTGDQPKPFPDGTVPDVTAGNLYKKRPGTYRWTPTHVKVGLTVAKGALLFLNPLLFLAGAATKLFSHIEKAVEKKKKTVFYDLYEPAVLPLTRKTMDLADKGKQAFTFEESAGGFVTASGEPIESIVDRCVYDEGFRTSCALLIPQYDRSLMGRKIIAKYHIYENPLPGIIPTRLPVLSIRESLSYRTSWQSVELGELARSINLAPGEEREITITRSYERETTSAETRTSVFELVSSESSDLAEEMERITSVDNEISTSTKSKTWAETKQHADVSAKTGKVSPYQGSAASSMDNTFVSSFEWGADTSLKVFNKSMNKVARKAAQSVNRNSRQEVSSTTTEKTTISNAETTTIKISNINQGRTLNLMFYNVFNRYAAGLYLDDLKLEVRDGVELIAGSGVYSSRTFQLNQIEDLLSELSRTPLPLDMNEEGQARYKLTVLDTLDWLIHHEYEATEEDLPHGFQQSGPTSETGARAGKAGTDGASGETNGSQQSTIARVSFKRNPGDTAQLPVSPDTALMVAAAGRKATKDDPVKALEARKSALLKVYDSIHIDDMSLDETSLLVASPGLYLDAIIGVRSSTEPYSEEMRKQEIRMRAAEVAEAQARTAYQLAQAGRIAGMAFSPGASSSNAVIGILPDEQFQSLSVRLKFPLGPGKWVLCVDGKPLDDGELPKKMAQRLVLQFDWSDADAHEWMRDDRLSDRLTLLNLDTEEVVR